MADFRETKKNLHREWGLLSGAWGVPTPQLDGLLAWRGHKNLGEGLGWNQSSGWLTGQWLQQQSTVISDLEKA